MHDPTGAAKTPKASSLVRRKTTRISRQLTQHKIGLAWERVRRVVRAHCRQRGPQCPQCQCYGHHIEFQLTAEYQPVTLDLEDDRIIARVARKRLTIRMVRIRGGGSGYVLRRKIRTATWLLVELLKEARRQE